MLIASHTELRDLVIKNAVGSGLTIDHFSRCLVGTELPAAIVSVSSISHRPLLRPPVERREFRFFFVYEGNQYDVLYSAIEDDFVRFGSVFDKVVGSLRLHGDDNNMVKEFSPLLGFQDQDKRAILAATRPWWKFW
jgi:hypothetical protein